MRKENNKQRERRKRIVENVNNFGKINSKCSSTSDIEINGEFSNVLIDTGAKTSFISEAYCIKRNFKRSKLKNAKRWVTATGQPISIGGQVELELTIGAKRFKAEFIIAQDLAHTVIIGENILRKHQFVVDYKKNEIRCEEERVHINSISPCKIKMVHAWENQIVNPYSTETVWVNTKLPPNPLWIKGLGRNNTVEIVTQVIKGKIPILIRNTKATPMHIRRGDPIASITVAEIVQEITDEKSILEFLNKEVGKCETVNNIEKSRTNTNKPWRPSENIKISNTALTQEQKQKLKALIDKNWQIFSRDDEDLGHVPERYGTHDILLTSEIPIKQRAYTTPQAKDAVVKTSIEKMQKMQVIEETSSNWSSPIVLVKKPDGSERFCVDYRKLNDLTIKDNYPMPNVQSKINKLHGCNLFTSLDCTSGYWQIQLSERAKQFAAFICSHGLFDFNYMPFGLCNAGATFQRVIELILIKLKNSTAYIDDILTFSKGFEDHYNHLEKLFERLRQANLKVKPSKCKIACDNVMFLGYNISDKGISVDESRIKSLKNYPRPTKTKEIKQFLGLSGFYRQFIPNFAELTEPFNRLTRKNVKFEWSEECEKSFQSLIRQLISKPILNYPDFEKTFIISTDASNIGLGAILSQKDENGQEKPIYYASRALNIHERNYSTIEKELLAIVYACEKFKYYVYGREFLITTDHNPLVYLKNITLSSEKLTKWRLKLTEYNFKILYRKGKENGNADALSRVEVKETKQMNLEALDRLLAIVEKTQVEKIEILEHLSAIASESEKVDQIIYKKGSILETPGDAYIAYCTTTELDMSKGIAQELNTKFDGTLSPRLKYRVGTCYAWKQTPRIIALISKRWETSKPSFENFESCLTGLKDYCLK